MLIDTFLSSILDWIERGANINYIRQRRNFRNMSRGPPEVILRPDAMRDILPKLRNFVCSFIYRLKDDFRSSRYLMMYLKHFETFPLVLL